MHMTFSSHARVLALALALATPVATAAAQTTDPVIGTWQLDLAKSSFRPGPAPKSATRTYTAAPNGYTFSATAVDAEGKSTTTSFTAALDGKFVPVTGSATIDEISVKKINAHTVEATQKKGGKVVGHSKRTVSKDGKTLTNTTTGKNAAGKSYKNVEVFTRQ